MIVASGREQHRLDHRFRREAGFPYWTLVALLDGATRVAAGSRSGVVDAHSLALIRPGTAYVVNYGGGQHWNEAWFILDPPRWWHELLEWPEVVPGVMAVPAADSGDAARAACQVALAACEEAQGFMTGTLPDRERFATNALERALLHARLAVTGSADEAMDPGVRGVRDYLASAPAEPLTISRLARRARMSPSHFAHLFAAQVGEPPMRFLERCRLDRAKRLLLGGDRSISEIAPDCGFDNPFHFSTRFRRRFGRSPRAFRRDPS